MPAAAVICHLSLSCHLSVEFSCLQVDPSRGLTHLEADRRRRLCGANEFDVAEADPLWKKYLEQAPASFGLSSFPFLSSHGRILILLVSLDLGHGPHPHFIHTLDLEGFGFGTGKAISVRPTYTDPVHLFGLLKAHLNSTLSCARTTRT